MNLSVFEKIVNLSDRLIEQTKNNMMTVDEFGYWTEGVLLVNDKKLKINSNLLLFFILNFSRL